jgi:hypothetical protein
LLRGPSERTPAGYFYVCDKGELPPPTRSLATARHSQLPESAMDDYQGGHLKTKPDNTVVSWTVPLSVADRSRPSNAEVRGSSPRRPTKISGLSHSGTNGRAPGNLCGQSRTHGRLAQRIDLSSPRW